MVGQVDEKKTAAASYILTFYQQVLAVTNSYSNYNNILIELRYTYGDEPDFSKMEPNHSEVVKQTIQNTRFEIQRTYIQYVSIRSALKLRSDVKLEASFKKIKKNFVMSMDDIEDFVIRMNKFLLENVVKTLLEDSGDVMANVYGDTAQ